MVLCRHFWAPANCYLQPFTNCGRPSETTEAAMKKTLTFSAWVLGSRTKEHVCRLFWLASFLSKKKQHVCRLIRGMKNRYGAIEEVGVFSMNEKGLEAVPNPSALFLTNRDSSPGVSSAVTVQMEGSRPLLLEVQALCSPVQVHSASRRLM